MFNEILIIQISEMFQHIKQTVTHRVDEAIKYNESVRNYLLDKVNRNYVLIWH